MSPLPPADLTSLAVLAQSRDSDLRPALLRAQTDLFVEGPRDPAAVATYEALALGLIPLVGDEVLLATATALLAVPEAPRAVLAALAQRLSGASPDSRGGDLALARDRSRVLDGHLLDGLVERARRDKDLAFALLARPELSLFQRAELYRFAPERERAALRDELARRLPHGATPRFAVPAEIRPLLTGAIDGRQVARVLARVGFGPSLEAVEAGLAGRVAEQELFALALLALGLGPDECTRVILTLDPAVSHSVDCVLHLARLVRATPPQVATFLAASDSAFDASAARPEAHPHPRREPDPRGQIGHGRARPEAPRAAAER